MTDLIIDIGGYVLAAIPGLVAMGYIWFKELAKNDPEQDWKDAVVETVDDIFEEIAKVDTKVEEVKTVVATPAPAPKAEVTDNGNLGITV